jgi:hypothetical protein
MKVIFLVTGGRGGSDFFQGLLDGHNQILQIPGVLAIDDKFLDLFNSKNFNQIAEKFINYVPMIFDSTKNKLERHNRLGKNKNEFYKVDKKKFEFFFNKLSINQKNYNNFFIIKNLYKAYYLACNKKIDKAKIILIHTHTVDMTKKFLKFEKIKNFSIIHTMRYPINALISPINNWLKYKDGKFFFPRELYFQYDLAFNGLSDLTKISKNVRIILLENLIKNKEIVMKDFCRIFKINFSKNLLKCTYFGKQWWGDEISGKWIDKSIKFKKPKKKELNLFFEHDLIYFFTLSRCIIKNYFKNDYKNISKKNNKF